MGCSLPPQPSISFRLRSSAHGRKQERIHRELMASSISLCSSITHASPGVISPSRPSRARRNQRILPTATKKKVNRYDGNWKKEWYGAGLFSEVSEEVTIDVVKELEKNKVLSNVEKAGLLSKAEELGFTLSSIEKLGFFSKAEELGLLSLVDKLAGASPSALASVALPLLGAAVAAVILIPDDSAALVVVQTVVAAMFTVGATGLFVGSVVLGGLQESK